MQKNMKKRLAVVSGVIVLVVIVVLAIVAGGTAARNLTVAQAATGEYAGDKVQVAGNVTTGSFTMGVGQVTFSIYDPDDTSGAQLSVRYEGAVSSTFGNEVSAIVTGRMDENGCLQATELVTKCPSKYESGVDALTVAKVFEYGDKILNKPIKVMAYLVPDSLTTPGKAVRLAVSDGEGQQALEVQFDGAIPDAVTDGMALVITGNMAGDGIFHATDVALSK